MLPSLEPEGQIVITGKFVEQGHIAMVTKWNGKGTPQEPTIIKKHGVEVAKERWGERWGLIEPVTLATTTDYMDTHTKKYWKIMGEPPPTNITLSK
eukprot:10022605-Karenia_brevis.AAC.1